MWLYLIHAVIGEPLITQLMNPLCMLITVCLIPGKESAKSLGPFLMEFFWVNLMNSLHIPDEKSI